MQDILFYSAVSDYIFIIKWKLTFLTNRLNFRLRGTFFSDQSTIFMLISLYHVPCQMAQTSLAYLRSWFLLFWNNYLVAIPLCPRL